MAATSNIIIDKISTYSVSGSTVAFDHEITSQDAVLVVAVGIGTGSSTSVASVKYNGVSLVKLITTSSSDESSWWVMMNPPVGKYNLQVITNGVAQNTEVTAISLLGVSKKNPIPLSFTTANVVATTLTVTVTNPVAGAIALDAFITNATSSAISPATDQTQVSNQLSGAAQGSQGVSFKVLPRGENTMTWNAASNVGMGLVVIVLEPAQASSISFPNIDFRNINDVNLFNWSSRTNVQSLSYASTFYRNSYLNTIGRIVSASNGGPYGILSSANTQSSIIIDNITPATAGSGNFSHSIYNPNSVLLVSSDGGSASTTAMKFNGTPMTLLREISYTRSAGNTVFLSFWIMLNPPVGTYEIQTTGSPNANVAFTLIGADSTTLPQVFSNAVSNNPNNPALAELTFSTSVANGFVIDFISAFSQNTNLIANMEPNPNQSKLFQMASQALNHSYAIVNPGTQTLSWNLKSIDRVSYGILAIVFKPRNFSSAWYPNIGLRNIRDVIQANALDNGLPNASQNKKTYGYFPANFFKNSFLHTIGRFVAGFGAQGIAFDAASNSGYQAAQSSYSFARTCTGANRFLTVDVSILSAGQTVTSVIDDFDGTPVNMVFIGARSTVTSFGRIETWGLVAPATGTKNIQVNLSGVVISASGAVSYTGVHQTSPTEAFNSNQATNVGAADATVDITSVADKCWIHAAIATDDTSVSAGQTTRNNVTGAGGSGADEDNNGPVTPAGLTTMTYTGVGALATWAIAGYAIRPVAAAGLSGGGNDWPTFQSRGFWSWRF